MSRIITLPTDNETRCRTPEVAETHILSELILTLLTCLISSYRTGSCSFRAIDKLVPSDRQRRINRMLRRYFSTLIIDFYFDTRPGRWRRYVEVSSGSARELKQLGEQDVQTSQSEAVRQSASDGGCRRDIRTLWEDDHRVWGGAGAPPPEDPGYGISAWNRSVFTELTFSKQPITTCHTTEYRFTRVHLSVTLSKPRVLTRVAFTSRQNIVNNTTFIFIFWIAKIKDYI